MVADHKIDKHRIFVTGLSAGGAMTSVMLATYPDVFAAGAIIAGLPYGIASNVREALSGMLRSSARSPEELGTLVRNASKHRAPWPKVSVWHGSADRTVNSANANEIVKQWLDVHKLPSGPMSEGVVDGYPHQVWWNADGETVVESYTITDMAHGTPLGKAENDERYGKEGPFLIEAGISSSHHIASFFGLTAGIHQPEKAAKPASRKAAESPSAKLIPLASPISAPAPARGSATLHRAGEERIGHSLVADPGAGAMAADEADIISERQQLLLDRFDQGAVIATRKIGATDRAVEQDIADMGEAHILVEKDHAAGGM